MSPLEKRSSGDLTTLAVSIRREHEACEVAFGKAVAHAVEAGRLLLDAKSQLRHGEWLPWLGANFPGSERTARNYMRLATNSARVADLPTVREAVAALAEPKQLVASDDPPPPFADFDKEVWFSLTEHQRLHLHNLAQGIEAQAEQLKSRACADPDLAPLLRAEANIVRADGKCEILAHTQLYYLEQAPEVEQTFRLRARSHKLLAEIQRWGL